MAPSAADPCRLSAAADADSSARTRRLSHVPARLGVPPLAGEGWEDKLIAVEYDGDDHRDKPRWRSDIIRSEYLAHLRWKHIRVVAGERETDVLRRVARAWASR